MKTVTIDWEGCDIEFDVEYRLHRGHSPSMYDPGADDEYEIEQIICEDKDCTAHLKDAVRELIQDELARSKPNNYRRCLMEIGGYDFNAIKL